MAIVVDDFVSLAAWTANDVSISPAGWAYHPGNGTGTNYAYRTMDVGAIYIESKIHFDTANGSWAMIKMQTTTTNLYNYSGAALMLAQDGSVHHFVENGGATGQLHAGVGAPMSSSTAVRVGLHCRASALAYDFYLNDALVGTRTVSAIPTGTLFSFGAYNGVNGHFDYFASSDRNLSIYDARNVASGVSY